MSPFRSNFPGRELRRDGRKAPIFLLMLFLASCAGLPIMAPVDLEEASKRLLSCNAVFPKGRWQFAHVITATLPRGGETRLMGVTEISSDSGRIHAVMMTIEGLVLFDGVRNGQLTINRSVSPFNTRAFAEGLMEDIHLIFLEPDGETVSSGTTEDGYKVCRFLRNGDIVDVMLQPDNVVEIRKYRNSRLIRKVIADKTPISAAKNITLTAYGAPGYRLNLRLISAEQLEVADGFRRVQLSGGRGQNDI